MVPGFESEMQFRNRRLASSERDPRLEGVDGRLPLSR